MDEKINELEKVCEDVISAIDSFPSDKREKILFDKWSLKDSIAHMSGWNLLRVKEIGDLLNGKEIDYILDFDKFNAYEVGKRKEMSWGEVYSEFVKTCDRLVEAFKRIPMELWDRKVWLDKDFTPNKWVDIDISHMRGEHLKQLSEYTE